MQYSAHAPFVAPARQNSELWRLFLGLLLTAVVYALGVAAIFGLVVLWSGVDGAQKLAQGTGGQRRTNGNDPASGDLRRHGAGPDAGRPLPPPPPGSRACSDRPASFLRDFGLAFLICVAVFAVTALIPTPRPDAASEYRDRALAEFPAAGAGGGADPDRRGGSPVSRLHAATTGGAGFPRRSFGWCCPRRFFAGPALPARNHGDNTWLVMGRRLRLRAAGRRPHGRDRQYRRGMGHAFRQQRAGNPSGCDRGPAFGAGALRRADLAVLGRNQAALLPRHRHNGRALGGDYGWIVRRQAT